MGEAQSILVAEHERIIANCYASILCEAGYEIVGPASSPEAVSGLLDRERIDAA